MRIQRCKGMRDLSPEEMRKFRLVEEAFRDRCLRWGYEEVRTPILEYLHLFTSAGTLTPTMLGKVYSFLDWDGWSGERVVLRPDNTIPAARLYIDSMEEKGLAKLFYVANTFIFEETGEKTRERWQCGAELVGAGSPSADVELMMLALEVLKKLGLEGIELKLAHAGVIKALLQKLGLSPKEQNGIFDQILDGDEEAIARIESEKPELGKALLPLIELKGKSADFIRDSRALSQNLPELKPYVDNFIRILDLLETLGCNYQIDIASGRGFEYYTGVIFQLFIGGEKIGGGGRYDNLIPLMGGKDTPASGFALYLDRLMNLIKPETMAEPLAQRILIMAEPEVVKEGFNTANCLREAGYVTELNLGVQELADFRWVLEVKSKVPQFVLTDQVKHQKFEVQTSKKVLALLNH
jgi:histidyl-tRNA synthetase